MCPSPAVSESPLATWLPSCFPLSSLSYSLVRVKAPAYSKKEEIPQRVVCRRSPGRYSRVLDPARGDVLQSFAPPTVLALRSPSKILRLDSHPFSIAISWWPWQSQTACVCWGLVPVRFIPARQAVPTGLIPDRCVLTRAPVSVVFESGGFWFLNTSVARVLLLAYRSPLPNTRHIYRSCCPVFVSGGSHCPSTERCKKPFSASGLVCASRFVKCCSEISPRRSDTRGGISRQTFPPQRCRVSARLHPLNVFIDCIPAPGFFLPSNGLDARSLLQLQNLRDLPHPNPGTESTFQGGPPLPSSDLISFHPDDSGRVASFAFFSLCGRCPPRVKQAISPES